MGQKSLSMVNLLCYIREQLVDAKGKILPPETMTKLLYTLTTLDEAAAYFDDARFTAVIEDLTNSLQHLSLAEFKITLPSEEDIRKLE